VTEDEYVAYLRDERRLFAWCMRHHGGRTPDEAEAEARERYPYEPADAPFRGLIFHDEAWHWAMLRLHGELYWLARPELRTPPPDYPA
jgi:hypothetical protein